MMQVLVFMKSAVVRPFQGTRHTDNTAAYDFSRVRDA